jgi:hypothetical protein
MYITELDHNFYPSDIYPWAYDLTIAITLCRFLVDNTPIRDFKNHESNGVSFPKNQPMSLYSSLWNADDWATQGGHVKTDWSQAPFTAYYRNFNANACVWSRGASSCSSTNQMATTSTTQTEWYNHQLDSMSYRRMRWVQRKFMIYNYCSDVKRFPRGLPLECTLRWSLHLFL